MFDVNIMVSYSSYNILLDMNVSTGLISVCVCTVVVVEQFSHNFKLIGNRFHW